MAMERSAELCRSEEDKHRLTLLSTGAKLSHRASTLCLMLACCECDRIPAFLFSRPYSLQRRWNSDGEVQNLPPPSASAVPQWSSGFFEETIDAGHPKFFFQATAIGLCAGHRLSQPLITIEPPPGKPFGKHSLPRANVHLFRVSEDVQTLFEFNVIEPVFDEGWLYLGVVGSWKDSIRRKCSTSDRVRLLSDLVKLVTFSFPDLYSEMLWQVVRLRSQEIIESTILPFLSVVDWQKLTDNDFTNLDEDYESLTLIRKIYSDTECLRALLRFLVHYSISQGFSTSSCIPFEYDVLQKIHFYDGDRRTGFHLIIAFKEQFCRYLSTLEVKADSFHAITYLVYPYLGAEDFTALLGFAIDFLLRSITVPLCQVKLTMLLAWWKAARGVTRQSTMGTIAESLLSTDTDFKNVFASGIEDGDLHIRVALAFAMAERNWFPSAKMLLEACVDKVGVEYSSESFEYALVSAELVNCCNVLRQDSEGELWGSQALQHRLALDLGYRADSIYLKIALADSLIGQSKYEKAEALLNDILEGTCPSVYLTITTALRLNKVRRRLGDKKALTLDKSSALWKAVDQIDSTQQVLKVECAEEVASTISLLRQGGSIESPEARDIIAAIRTKMVDDPIGWK
ncbi:MAG: hypothetical protein M1830_005104, partial [Pleopsidium flavum]